MSQDILDVDLLAFEIGDSRSRDAVVDGVMTSLRNGFVYTAHDISETLLDDAYGMLEAFFGLADAAKADIMVPGSHGSRGYTGLLVETAASADVPDWKEMLNWGTPVPTGHPLQSKYPDRYLDNVFPDDLVPNIGSVLTEFHARLFELQQRFLRVIAVGIGCDQTFFDAMLRDSATLSRAIHYPAMDLAPDADHVWAGSHADINLITALPRATTKGLQVQIGDLWVDALPPDNHVIINTGIMLEHITNGIVPSGIHRVVADAGQKGDRLSVVQFCHPSPWTVLSPVHTCVTADNPQRFAPITSADRLDEVLYEINLIEDARRL